MVLREWLNINKYLYLKISIELQLLWKCCYLCLFNYVLLRAPPLFPLLLTLHDPHRTPHTLVPALKSKALLCPAFHSWQNKFFVAAARLLAVAARQLLKSPRLNPPTSPPQFDLLLSHHCCGSRMSSSGKSRVCQLWHIPRLYPAPKEELTWSPDTWSSALRPCLHVVIRKLFFLS